MFTKYILRLRQSDVLEINDKYKRGKRTSKKQNQAKRTSEKRDGNLESKDYSQEEKHFSLFTLFINLSIYSSTNLCIC